MEFLCSFVQCFISDLSSLNNEDTKIYVSYRESYSVLLMPVVVKSVPTILHID